MTKTRLNGNCRAIYQARTKKSSRSKKSSQLSLSVPRRFHPLYKWASSFSFPQLRGRGRNNANSGKKEASPCIRVPRQTKDTRHECINSQFLLLSFHRWFSSLEISACTTNFLPTFAFPTFLRSHVNQRFVLSSFLFIPGKESEDLVLFPSSR